VATRIGSGLAAGDGGVDAFAEAAARAALRLGGMPADLVVVFAGTDNLDHADDGLAAVADRLGDAALIGCGAQGVVADGREIESGGVAVWAASLGNGGSAETFHLEALQAGDAIAVAGMPNELGKGDAMLLLADPYTFPVEALLGELAVENPGMPVIGGIASAGGGPGMAVLMHDGRVEHEGAVGVTLTGVDVRPCVSQGARPIGPEMVITAGDGNVIEELASQPALERIKEAIAELDTQERALAAQGLLLGIVIDPNQPEYERGDFLIRGLLDVDDETGTVTVGERVRIGQTVRLQVRDGDSADEDLRAVLDAQLRDLRHPPAGTLLFTCNGRGAGMFGVQDHDASALDYAFAGAPTAGFFCAGEIGPVGNRNFLHGFTATMAVFA
jgi:small ligand-binding sensory domain FIST